MYLNGVVVHYLYKLIVPTVMESVVQVIGAALIALFTGASAYQIRSNKAQDDRLGKIEVEIPVLRNNIINFNDVILSQFGNLNDRMSELQEQRKESVQQLDIRLNHLDNLLAGIYEVYVRERDNTK